MHYFRSSRTIDQTISIVRKQLGQGERIHTVFGVGYRHEFLLQAATASPTRELRHRVTPCRDALAAAR
jgi:DNA-binding winged helix-turn-helix (wHTH) protein